MANQNHPLGLTNNQKLAQAGFQQAQAYGIFKAMEPTIQGITKLKIIITVLADVQSILQQLANAKIKHISAIRVIIQSGSEGDSSPPPPQCLLTITTDENDEELFNPACWDLDSWTSRIANLVIRKRSSMPDLFSS